MVTSQLNKQTFSCNTEPDLNTRRHTFSSRCIAARSTVHVHDCSVRKEYQRQFIWFLYNLLYLSFQYSIHQSHVWKYFKHQGLLSKQTGSLMMSSIYLNNKFLLLLNAFKLSTCTFGCGHMFYVSYNFIQSASNMTSDLENRQQQEIRSF